MKKKISVLLILLLVIGLFAGCGSSKSASYDSVATSEAYVYNGYDGGSYSGKADYAYGEADYGWTGEPMAAEVTEYSKEQSATGSQLPANVKLIYTADINMESTEFDTALEGLNELVISMGGYFENSSLDNYSSYRSGNYTVRVPAQKFEAFCTAVGSICQVRSISRSAQDVSEYYYDTESRLTTQKTKLARLQELLEKAEKMEDIITLEAAISDTELTIENLTGTLRKYDSLVGYSTINLYLQEVYKLSEIEEPAIGFGARLAAAFKSGSSRFVDNFQYFLIDLANAWVGWLIFLVIAAIVILLIVRGARKSRARRWGEERPARKKHLRKRRAAAEDSTAAAPASEEKNE